MCLTLEGITKTYRSGAIVTKAVTDYSYHFVYGKSYAIVGPSGCGKTSLLNVIGLLSRKDKGSLIINGKRSDNFTQKEISYLRNHYFGYVAQNFLIIPDYTVRENIEIPLLYTKITKKKREQLISEISLSLDIYGLLDKTGDSISGGEKQKTAVARAVVNNPKVLLADEPTGSLDSHSGQEVFNILKSYVHDDSMLIIVTHNNEIANQCNVILKMKDGLLTGVEDKK